MKKIILITLILCSLTHTAFARLVTEGITDLINNNSSSGFEKIATSFQYYFSNPKSNDMSGKQIENVYTNSISSNTNQYENGVVYFNISNLLAENNGRVVNVLWTRNTITFNSTWVIWKSNNQWRKHKLIENINQDKAFYRTESYYWAKLTSPLIIIGYSYLQGNASVPEVEVFEVKNSSFIRVCSYYHNNQGSIGFEHVVSGSETLPGINITSFRWDTHTFEESHVGPHIYYETLLKYDKKIYVVSDTKEIPSPYATLWHFIDYLQNNKNEYTKTLIIDKNVLDFAIEHKIGLDTKYCHVSGNNGYDNKTEYVEFVGYNITYRADFIKQNNNWLIKSINIIENKK